MQPIPVLVLPWNPISPFPEHAGKWRKSLISVNGNAHAHTYSHYSHLSSASLINSNLKPKHSTTPSSSTSPLNTPIALLQFSSARGCGTWDSRSVRWRVRAYWLVFYAVWVWVAGEMGCLFGRRLGGKKAEGVKEKKVESVRRPFGYVLPTFYSFLARLFYVCPRIPKITNC